VKRFVVARYWASGMARSGIWFRGFSQSGQIEFFEKNFKGVSRVRLATKRAF